MLSTDGSTCKVLEVAKVGIVVVTNLVWWGWGEENEEDGLIDIDGDLVDGWREDTDCEGDDINTADAIPGAVEDADDDTKTGVWETFPLDITEWRLSETPAKCNNFTNIKCKA